MQTHQKTGLLCTLPCTQWQPLCSSPTPVRDLEKAALHLKPPQEHFFWAPQSHSWATQDVLLLWPTVEAVELATGSRTIDVRPTTSLSHTPLRTHHSGQLLPLFPSHQTFLISPGDLVWNVRSPSDLLGANRALAVFM